MIDPSEGTQFVQFCPPPPPLRRLLRPLCSQRGREPAAAPGHAPGNDTDEAEEEGSETWKIYSLICRCDGGDGGGEAEVK